MGSGGTARQPQEGLCCKNGKNVLAFSFLKEKIFCYYQIFFYVFVKPADNEV